MSDAEVNPFSDQTPLAVVKGLVADHSLRYVGASPNNVDTLYATEEAAQVLRNLGLEVARADSAARGIISHLNYDRFPMVISISRSRKPAGSLVEVLGGYGAVDQALQGIFKVPPRRMQSSQFDARSGWGRSLD